ncbi:MAG: hypothetical protein WAL91_06910, partial [Propionicimonas sp.]
MALAAGAADGPDVLVLGVGVDVVAGGVEPVGDAADLDMVFVGVPLALGVPLTLGVPLALGSSGPVVEHPPRASARTA